MVNPLQLHIMHVPGSGREQYVEAMLKECPESYVHADPRRLGATQTWANVMMSMAKNIKSKDSWHIQVNDDVILLDGWKEHLKQATLNSPSEVLGLAWIGTRRGAKAVEKGVPYASGDYLAAGYGVAYHSSIVQPLAQFAHYAALTGYKHDDSAMGMWCRSVGIKQALLARSLFNIAPVPSLLGHQIYPSASHTIDDAPQDYRYDKKGSWFVDDNCMGQREDEPSVMRAIRKAGWNG